MVEPVMLGGSKHLEVAIPEVARVTVDVVDVNARRQGMAETDFDHEPVAATASTSCTIEPGG